MKIDNKPSIDWQSIGLLVPMLGTMAIILVLFGQDINRRFILHSERLTVSRLEWQRVQEVKKLHDGTGQWVWEHNLITSGSPQNERVWPTLDFTHYKDFYPRLAGRRYENLYVFFRTPDSKVFRYETPTYNVWIRFDVGESFWVDFNPYGKPQWANLLQVD